MMKEIMTIVIENDHVICLSADWFFLVLDTFDR